MRAGRTVASLTVGVVAGITVATLVGIPLLRGPAGLVSLLSNAFTFWGFVLGGFTAVASFGIAFAILNRRNPRTARWGRRIAGLTLAVFAAATMWWIYAVGAPSLWTLEGLWMYPLVLLTSLLAIALLRPRRSRGFWDEPPA